MCRPLGGRFAGGRAQARRPAPRLPRRPRPLEEAPAIQSLGDAVEPGRQENPLPAPRGRYAQDVRGRDLSRGKETVLPIGLLDSGWRTVHTRFNPFDPTGRRLALTKLEVRDLGAGGGLTPATVFWRRRDGTSLMVGVPTATGSVSTAGWRGLGHLRRMPTAGRRAAIGTAATSPGGLTVYRREWRGGTTAGSVGVPGSARREARGTKHLNAIP